MLIHQLPPKPNYFRVKVWRRLQKLGAVAIKNSVYVLPRSDSAREDFEWVLREIVQEGGDATVCEARFVEGLSDDAVEALFDAARDADYAQIVDAVRQFSDGLPAARIDDETRSRAEVDLARLRRRLGEVTAIDFFGAAGREPVEDLLTDIEKRLRVGAPAAAKTNDLLRADDFRERTWVTRKGIHVDRMATAWLVRRFIDSRAQFKFVPGKGYRPAAREIRFDMFEAEFTHDGDRCTFEVLLDRIGLDDPALRHIGEIVHDIDIKDGKFDRPEAAGIAQVIAGIAMAHDDDEARLQRSAVVFEDLLTYFRRKRRSAAKAARKDQRP
jgi:hypothetical protein